MRHVYSSRIKGYVQGMSDLCAPVYVVMGGDEEMTFWCFVEIMDRMVSGVTTFPSSLTSSDARLWHVRNRTSFVIRAE